jgi:putative Holliday junction resolvase
MRTLALDYGDKRIGVAVSDPLGILAVGLETIRRMDSGGLKKSLIRLRELVKQYDVGEILVGYPKNMNNTEGVRCEKTRAFKDRLEIYFNGMPVILWDERLSTVAAMRSMASLSAEKRDRIVDRIAAVYILQGYLDWKNMHKVVKEVNSLDGFDDDQNDYSIITMLDENGESVDFVVLDEASYNGTDYLLVLEEESVDDDAAEASIIKAVNTEGEDVIYEFVEDDEEFNAVAGLFQDNDDYELEF